MRSSPFTATRGSKPTTALVVACSLLTCATALGQEITVTYPDANTVWQSNGSEVAAEHVLWEGTESRPATSVYLRLIVDGAEQRTTQKANDGFADFDVPPVGDTNNARIRVYLGDPADGNFGESAAFRIRVNPSQFLRVTSPVENTVWNAGSTVSVGLEWQGFGGRVRIDLSTDRGQTFDDYLGEYDLSPSIAVNVPLDAEADKARVRVQGLSSLIVDYNSGDFVVNGLPTCDAGGPYDGATREAIQFDGSASDASSGIASYQWDFGDGFSGTGATPTHTYLVDGTFTVTLCVTDELGAENCCETAANISTDAQPPLCNAGGPYSGVTGQLIPFDGTGSTDDGSIGTFEWNYGDGNTASGSQTLHVYTTPGTYTVTLCVTDDVSLQSCCTTTATITAAQQPPVCDVGGPYGADTGDIINFDASGSSDPDGSITTYSWNFGDGTNGTGIQAPHAYGSTGTYVVTLCVTDDDAQQSCCATLAVISDAPPPVCDAGGPYSGVADERITFDGSGSSDVDGTITRYAWDFGDGGSGSAESWTHAYTSAGTYTVTLCVTDDDEQESCCATTAVISGPPQPPTCATGGPYSGTIGTSITFDGSGSTDDGTISTYDWDFGDGASGSDEQWFHTYTSSGTYTVTLCVTDDDGLESCCRTTASVNQVPICDAGGPYRAATGESIAFDASGSIDADGTITGYEWDFGDGAFGSDERWSHTYSASGTYTVTLTVTDDAGAESSCSVEASVTQSSLKVLVPNGDESWFALSSPTVHWLPAGPAERVHIEILWFDDDQALRTMFLAPNTPNDGQERVKLPQVNTSRATVRVSNADDAGDFDVSDLDFQIIASNTTVEHQIANARYYLVAPRVGSEDQLLSEVITGLGTYGEPNWLGFGAMGSRLTDHNPTVSTGHGYWIISRESRTLIATGTQLGTPTAVAVDEIGWFILGAPDFGAPYVLSSAMVTSESQGNPMPLDLHPAIADEVHWWVDGTGDFINNGSCLKFGTNTLSNANPRGGYLLYAHEPCVISFGEQAPLQGVAPAASPVALPEWEVAFTASAGAYRDHNVHLGVMRGAESGYAGEDKLKPPLPSVDLRLAIFQPDASWPELSTSYESAGDATHEWTLRVRGDTPDRLVTLSWDGATAAPRDLQLIDLDSGAIIDMRRRAAYEFALHDVRDFRVVHGGLQPSPPPSSNRLLATRPNPVRGPFEVGIDLARSGRVRATLFDVQGRAIGLLERHYAPGRHSIAWDTQAYAPGVYFLRVETEDGTFRRKLTVLR